MKQIATPCRKINTYLEHHSESPVFYFFAHMNVCIYNEAGSQMQMAHTLKLVLLNTSLLENGRHQSKKLSRNKIRQKKINSYPHTLYNLTTGSIIYKLSITIMVIIFICTRMQKLIKIQSTDFC